MNYYYHPDIQENFLSQEESSHAIKVLRKKAGDTIHLMDGKGSTYEAQVEEANFRKCKIKINSQQTHTAKGYSTHIAIAPTKNMDRLEWFVEKACELGVDKISLIETKRTERNKVNLERLEKKAISAMKQSKNFWKCEISSLQKFDGFISEQSSTDQLFIAYVETGNEQLLKQKLKVKTDHLVVIGPEGDFTEEEVKIARASGFQEVSLGTSILRTETAGVYAAALAVFVNQ